MRSQTAYVILGLLSIEGKQSGYDMRKTIQGSVGYFWGESFGQIYPMLRQLTAEGLIEQSGREGRGGRREYSLTAAGHARLREWLAVPYRMDPPRDEFLLKLFFGRGRGAGGFRAATCGNFRRKNRRLLATIEEIGRVGRERNGQHPHFGYWMLTLEYGVAQFGQRWSGASGHSKL